MITVVHCKKEPNHEYIGRPSPLGNPFVWDKSTPKGSTLPKYKEWLHKQIDSNNLHVINELNRLVEIARCGDLNLGCWCSPQPCHGDIIKEVLDKMNSNTELKVLECSSKGDKRFSAFYAKVTLWNKHASIEEHYQLCKRFMNPFGVFTPTTIKEAKGRQPSHIHLNNRDYHISFLSAFYSLLWLRYLDMNPDLVQYASTFDSFNDMFKGKSINCQADVIRKYVKEGREAVWQDCLPLWNAFQQN